MNFHLENQIVEIVVPFLDENRSPIVPTGITAALYDGEDRLLMSWGEISFDPAEVEARIVIHGSLNRLQGDELEEVRRLEVRLSHAGGFVVHRHAYGIEDKHSLQIMVNSFMTLETALLTARRFVNLTAFASTTEERQVSALIEAYHRLTNLAMIYTWMDENGRVESEHRIGAGGWNFIDADAFQTGFPTHFKRALRAAQLAEADELLQGSVVARKHAQGIASETIGESSVTLRAGFTGAGSSGVSSAALAHLAGYIDSTVIIGRA